MIATVLMTLAKLLEARDFFKAMMKPLPSEMPDKDAQDLSSATKQNAWMIGLCCLVLVASLIYTVTKLIMAHVCQDATWNVTGCVILHIQDANGVNSY